MSDDDSRGYLYTAAGFIGTAMAIGYALVSIRLGPEFAVPSLIVGVIGATVILRGPLGAALASRLSGTTVSAALADEVEELRQRLSEVESGAERLADVEERLDFAERLLAQRNDAILPGSERATLSRKVDR
jgi:hypothetical protein